MPAIVSTILGTLGAVALKMLMSLLTEAFLKKALIAGLEFLAKKTENEVDDQLVKAAKEAWESPAPAEK